MYYSKSTGGFYTKEVHATIPPDAVEITDANMLADGWQWYEWGSVMWDCVCGVCGGVFADTSPQLDCCEECRREVSCESATLCDGNISGREGNRRR